MPRKDKLNGSLLQESMSLERHDFRHLLAAPMVKVTTLGALARLTINAFDDYSRPEARDR